MSMPIIIEYFEKSGKGNSSSKGSKGYSSKGSKGYYSSKVSKAYGGSKVSKGYGTYYTGPVHEEGDDSGDYASDWKGGRF